MIMDTGIDDFRKIRERLFSLADSGNKAFAEKLITTKYQLLGVYTKDVQNIAKDVLKGVYGNPMQVLNVLSNEIFEEIAIKGFVIANLKISETERIKLIYGYLKLIDNWAICDGFVSQLRSAAKHKDLYWQVIKECLKYEDEYTLRFGIVLAMRYFTGEVDYVKQVLALYSSVKSDKYYVRMGIAWGVAEALVKNYELALPCITQKQLDRWTHNKAIQKATESYRLTQDQKNVLRTYKIGKNEKRLIIKTYYR